MSSRNGQGKSNSKRGMKSSQTSTDHAPVFESLESRTLLSASLDDGVLSLTGTQDADTIRIASGADAGQVVVYGVDGVTDGTVYDGVDGVVVNALGGNDKVFAGKGLLDTASALMSIEVHGGGGNDKIVGGDGDDALFGDSGRDSINGRAGDDDIDGGSDDNRVRGGQGDDNITTDSGNDRIKGGGGDDSIDSGAGDDWVWGGRGHDSVNGGDDDDHIFGGQGRDTIIGGLGLDWLKGGSGHDSMFDDLDHDDQGHELAGYDDHDQSHDDQHDDPHHS